MAWISVESRECSSCLSGCVLGGLVYKPAGRCSLAFRLTVQWVRHTGSECLLVVGGCGSPPQPPARARSAYSA